MKKLFNLTRRGGGVNYRSFSELSKLILQNLHKFSDFSIIVGVNSSGIIPAYLIGLFLNKKVLSINEFINNIKIERGGRPVNKEKNKKVLIVDDSISTGAALQRTKELLKPLNDKYEMSYISIYATEGSKNLVDCYLEIVPHPRIFQWSYLNHTLNKNFCIQFEGVIAKKYDGDDIQNSNCIFSSKYTVGTIFSNKSKKQKIKIEKWLKDNEIMYKNLVFPPFEIISKNKFFTFLYKIYVCKKSKTFVCVLENDLETFFIQLFTKKLCISKNSGKTFKL